MGCDVAAVYNQESYGLEEETNEPAPEVRRDTGEVSPMRYHFEPTGEFQRMSTGTKEIIVGRLPYKFEFGEDGPVLKMAVLVVGLSENTSSP